MPRKSLQFSFDNFAGAPKFRIPFHSLTQLQAGVAIPDETDIKFVFRNTGGSPLFIIGNEEDDGIQGSESSYSGDDRSVGESNLVASEESVDLEASSKEEESDTETVQSVSENAVSGQKRKRAGESDHHIEKIPKRCTQVKNYFTDVFTDEQVSWVAQETKGLDISEIRKPATWSDLEYQMIKEAQIRQDAERFQPLDATLVFTIWLELEYKDWKSSPIRQESRISTSRMESLKDKIDQITTRLGMKTADWHAILFAGVRISRKEAFLLYLAWRKRMWKFRGAKNSTSTFYSSNFVGIAGAQRDPDETDHKPIFTDEKRWIIRRTTDLTFAQIKTKATWRNIEHEMLSAAQGLGSEASFRPLDAVLIFTIWLDMKFTEWTRSSTYSIPPEGFVNGEEVSWLHRHTYSITTRLGMKVVDWHTLLHKMQGEANQRGGYSHFRSPSWEPVNVYIAWRKGMWDFRKGHEKSTFYSPNFQSKGSLTRP